jgi:Recombinase
VHPEVSGTGTACTRCTCAGRQVWNRQRKDEVLIDVTDVALGHMTKMRWNDQGSWIYSEEIVHPPIISDGTFQQAQHRSPCAQWELFYEWPLQAAE